MQDLNQEINSLRNTVIQHLQANGTLAQLRASLRSEVYKIVDAQEKAKEKKEDIKPQDPPAHNKLHQEAQSVICLELINEFLQFHELGYSQSVFLSESNLQHPSNRVVIQNKIGLYQNQQVNHNEPLLMTLLKIIMAGDSVVNPTKIKDTVKEQGSGEQDEEKQVGDDNDEIVIKNDSDEHVRDEIKIDQQEANQADHQEGSSEHQPLQPHPPTEKLETQQEDRSTEKKEEKHEQDHKRVVVPQDFIEQINDIPINLEDPSSKQPLKRPDSAKPKSMEFNEGELHDYADLGFNINDLDEDKSEGSIEEDDEMLYNMEAQKERLKEAQKKIKEVGKDIHEGKIADVHQEEVEKVVVEDKREKEVKEEGELSGFNVEDFDSFDSGLFDKDSQVKDSTKLEEVQHQPQEHQEPQEPVQVQEHVEEVHEQVQQPEEKHEERSLSEQPEQPKEMPEEEKSEPHQNIKEHVDLQEEEEEELQEQDNQNTHGFDNSFDLQLMQEFDHFEKALPPQNEDDFEYEQEFGNF